jgi:hypothetical protein
MPSHEPDQQETPEQSIRQLDIIEANYYFMGNSNHKSKRYHRWLRHHLLDVLFMYVYVASSLPP